VSPIGVLIIQLGTPDAPTPAAVRSYLREFLSDPRVVETPRWKWWFVLNLLILPRRSKESATKYARIWDSQTGSPLLHYTRLQAERLARELPKSFVVRFGMRYGNPSIARAIREFARCGVERLIVFPMYPQYAAASTATACDRLFDVLSQERYMPAIRVVPPYYAHPAYIRAQAARIRTELAKLDGSPPKVVLSFHGYPVAFVQRGDPYQLHVETTAQLLAKELRLADDQWVITYQSRFRNQVWLKPFTEETLCGFAEQGIRRIVVASPGFTADCLETIDEIGREAEEAFRKAGGEQLVRCPCLNDHPSWIEAMRQIVLEESKGWFTGGPASSTAASVADDESTVLDLDRKPTQA
jgi:ferrochelatase